MLLPSKTLAVSGSHHVREIIASLVVGAALLALGGGLLNWHLRVWHRHRNDRSLDHREMLHYRAQVRRRVQVSILLMLLGIMIPTGDALMTVLQRQKPGLVAAYWIAVLLLTFWVILLAALDWLSSRTNLRANKAALAALERKRRELEEEVVRLRHEHRDGSR